jgi:dephospho-CoA kinase
MHFRVGLVGALGCGKGEAVRHIQSIVTIREVSLSSLLKEELEKSNITPTRDTYRDLAHHLRKAHGCDILMQRALERLGDSKEDVFVFDGIRNIAELTAFHQSHPLAYSIGFPADPEIRFERAKHRHRNDDPEEEDKLRAIMEEEMTPGPDWGFQLPACLEAVRYTVDANQTVEKANLALDQIVQEIMRSAHNKKGAA